MKRPIHLLEKVVRDGIKGTNSDRSFAVKSRDSSSLLAEGVERFVRARREAEGEKKEKEREEIGLMLRAGAVHDMGEGTAETRGATWNMSLFWSLVVELTKVEMSSGSSFPLPLQSTRMTADEIRSGCRGGETIFGRIDRTIQRLCANNPRAESPRTFIRPTASQRTSPLLSSSLPILSIQQLTDAK